MLKSKLFVLSVVVLSSCDSRHDSSSELNQVESLQSAQVWQQVSIDPYPQKPVYDVTLTSFSSKWFIKSPDLLTDRAVTTVHDRDNIVPYFDKLVHPNGICLKGRWVIGDDKANKFTGAYAPNTNLPFIGRASVAFGNIMRGDYRAFGLAGKVFNEASGSTSKETANFFTIDDLAGTKAGDFTGVTLSNEPTLTTKNLVRQGPTIMAIGAATVVAFKLADNNPGLRQLYELSELGVRNKSQAVTPKWMHLKGADDVDMFFRHQDFRDDLLMDNFRNGLRFDIKVSSSGQEPGQMRKIGQIVIEESIISSSCDHRLHFHHPKFRKDLKHQ